MTRRSDERGAITVITAMVVPLFVVALFGVIDVAQLFIHKRQLQVRADAAALAAAGMYSFPNCNDAAITDKAEEYGTVRNTAPAGTVALAVNQPAFPGSSEVVDPDLTAYRPPCTANFVDVKVTESDVPLLLRAVGFDAINAQARVSLMDPGPVDDLTAIGVEESSPQRARVTFVNADTGAALGSAPLAKTGTSGGLETWGNATAPVTITADAPRIGVRVALSGSSTSTTCGDALVQCYGGTEATAADAEKSLARVRSYGPAPASASTLAQMVQQVTLTGSGCGATDDGFFHKSCTAAGVTVRLSNLTNAMKEPDVFYVSIGTGSQVLLTRTAGQPATASELEFTAASVPVPTGTGGHAVRIEARPTNGAPQVSIGGQRCRRGGSNPSQCIAGDLHRTFRRSAELTGPIASLAVFNEAAPTDPLNNVSNCAAGCTRRLSVAIGIASTNVTSNPTGDPVLLRTVGQNRPGSVVCDPLMGSNATDLQEMLAKGCGTTQFTKNTGTACPTTAVALWAMPEPRPCVAVFSGNMTQAVERGLDRRIHCTNGADCAPSTCVKPQTWPAPGTPDRRLVRVLLVPFGSFTQTTGSGVVPVTGFATFYITGYRGSGTPLCAGSDRYAPTDPETGASGTEAGALSGYYVGSVSSNTSGSASTPCNPQATPTPCVAVMTH